MTLPLPETRVGTAGFSIPKAHAAQFPPAEVDGEKLSHLQRYAEKLRCVEINSSFHRPHRRSTWERWAASTPAGFRFSVKVPKTITHEAKLVDTGGLLATFLSEATGLGEKLGPLLIQLPPRLAFDEGLAHEFLTTLRELHPQPQETQVPGGGLVALEPRHESWFAPQAGRLLRDFAVARVAADPPKGAAAAGFPAGWPGLRYWRLHGAPRTYYSEYTTTFLRRLATRIGEEQETLAGETWVIFDNTALGHATENALELHKRMAKVPRARRLSQ